jgi:hypothetical protein
MTGSATKQSILSFRGVMDCFAEPVIGRRFAPTRWLAMTISDAARPQFPHSKAVEVRKGPDNVEAPLTISCRAISCRDE